MKKDRRVVDMSDVEHLVNKDLLAGGRGRFRHSDGQDTVLEVSFHVVLVDRSREVEGAVKFAD